MKTQPGKPKYKPTGVALSGSTRGVAKKRARASIYSDPNDPLNFKERQFVDVVMATGDPLEAYREAMKPGKIPKPRDIIAARGLLAMPEIQKAIEVESMKIVKRFTVSADVAIQNVALIALADPLDLVDPATNQLKALRDIAPHARRAIQSVQQMADGSLKITLASKDKAAALLLASTGVTGSGVKGQSSVATRVRLAYDKSSGDLAVEFKSGGPVLVADESEQADS